MALPASVLQALPSARWQANKQPFLKEWRGLFHSDADAVACPQSTAEVAALLKACAQARVAIVPQGGNTGLVGGSVPYSQQLLAGLERPVADLSAYQAVVLLNLKAMNRIRRVDADNFSMAVEAGCILADVQAEAAAVNRYFPLSVASEHLCQIGGNLAGNCGGINVLRYGNARDLVLGIEAVTANGEVINQMTALRKNNMGYSLKDLLIGSEGTLAVITAAVLKLFPQPTQQATVMLGLSAAEQAVAILASAKEHFGDALSGCELISAQAMELALAYGENCQAPFAKSHAWYLLLEFSSFEASLAEQLRDFIATITADPSLAADVAVRLALEEAERQALWHLRKSIPGAQSRAGASIKHDVSVAVADVPELLERGSQAVKAAMPGIRPCPFGHLGDGNIHFNLSQPKDMAAADFLAQWQRFNRIIHDIVAQLNGSIAAEHGIGQLKLAEFERYGDPVALATMKAIKRALDPNNVLNPGKVLWP